ncbi:hypothetical protein Ancab_007884 [Ancistrocladus abbreviatus]
MEMMAASPQSTMHFANSACKTKHKIKASPFWTSCFRPANYPTPRQPIRTRLPSEKDSKVKPIPMPSSAPTIKRNENCSGKRSTSSDVLCLIDSLGLIATPDIYASLIDECTREGDPSRANELCAHIQSNKRVMHFMQQPCGLSLVNRVMLMDVSCGCVDASFHLFNKMSQRDSVSWAIMIAGFTHYAMYDQALDLFAKMPSHCLGQQSCVTMRVIVVCVLKACVCTRNMMMGKVVHGWLTKLNYDSDLFVGTALSDFYGKFRCYQEANAVLFDRIQISSSRVTVLWTKAIINNYHKEDFQAVISMFKEMGRVGIRKNVITFSSVVRACGRLKDGGWCGQQVHANAIKHGFDSQRFVQCSLLDMYGKCGLVQDARKVFDMIKWDEKNSSSWNAMVQSYLDNDLCVDAIKILYEMKAAGVQPQESLLNQVRVACGSSDKF